jgi:asparagine synthase (glutamine-hydrolysing)
VAGGAQLKDAYTISFSDADGRFDQQSDDSYFARLIADRLGLKLDVIEAERDFISLVPDLARFLEDGISDPAAINTYLICKAARTQGVKVMLSGQGADEFMGGYRRYQAERIVGRIPPWLRALPAMAARMLPGDLPGRFNARYRRLKRLASLAGSPREARLLGYYTWSTPPVILSMFRDPDGLEPGRDLVRMFDEVDDPDIIRAMMEVDQRFDLRSLNLTYTDRLSMAVGVEARVPLLDFDLVRLMNSLPTDFKIRHGQQKYIMKKALESSLPKQVIYREKAGFSLPIRAWMRRDHPLIDHYLDASRLERQGLFRADTIARMRAEQKAGSKDHANTLFSLFSIQIWLEAQGIV